MASELDLVRFERDLLKLRAEPDMKRISLERGDSALLEAFCDFRPRTHASELYRARLRWKDYDKAFSLKFVDPENGADTIPSAWPIFDGSRPGSLLACVPFTEEGIGLHPEWAPLYVAPQQPLQFAVLQLQHLLDNTYGGRGTA